MGKEIERKFLLSFLPEGMSGVSMRQGYLQSEKERAVRVRTVEKDGSKKGVLTIKGMGSESGMSRYEFETEIPVLDADHLLSLCDKPLIEKTRYKYDYKGLTWEIDKFQGVNDGLVVAEVELDSEDQQFEKPDFIGEEVTGQEKYFNMMLLKSPYTTWKKE
jgi:adenylate cyclase